jgi:DNA-directed RNA polymerase subunit K/omega
MSPREVKRLKFYDIDAMAKKLGIDNKYLLTTLVSGRARSISEQKGRILEEEEKYISVVLDDLDEERLAVIPATKPSQESSEGKEDVGLEA